LFSMGMISSSFWLVLAVSTVSALRIRPAGEEMAHV
jgi:hypothetical protein